MIPTPIIAVMLVVLLALAFDIVSSAVGWLLGICHPNGKEG